MHAVIKDNLESYLDGSLLPFSQREVEAHLHECAACRAQLDEARLTHEWMKVLVAEPAMPAPGFYGRVRTRIASESTQVWPFWQLVPAFGRQLAYALALTVLAGGGYLASIQLSERRSTAESLTLHSPAIHSEAPDFTADAHSNRERVMMALVAPVRNVEGD